MTTNSRSPRRRVVDEKKIARASSAKTLTATDRAHCESLRRLIEQMNGGVPRGRPREQQFTDAFIAGMAKPLGGSGHSQQWWAYRHAKKSVPLVDKMIICMLFSAHPDTLFPEWRQRHQREIAGLRVVSTMLDKFEASRGASPEVRELKELRELKVKKT